MSQIYKKLIKIKKVLKFYHKINKIKFLLVIIKIFMFL